MELLRAIRRANRSRTVHEDWFAWLPQEMDQLFDATRSELECSNSILNVTLDEALALCDQGQFASAQDRTVVFAELFDRLAIRLRLVISTIRDHGTHFNTLPNVAALVPSNFRGTTAQRISMMNSLLARVLFRERTRFFHKLHALGEIIEELQKETHAIVEDVSEGAKLTQGRAWQALEVLGYDLNTCMGETTVILKSFFCALPGEELKSFRRTLMEQLPALHPHKP